MSWKAGIVGEANYQSTIARCSPGDEVQIAHEVGNPYDDEALVVLTADGGRIGYIGRDHWIQELIHDEGRSCEATIESITPGGSGKLGVVLNIVKASGPTATVRYAR